MMTDEEMVLEALRRVQGVKAHAAAARKVGVSANTIARWRSGEIPTPLRSDTRKPLERFLGLSAPEDDALMIREAGPEYVPVDTEGRPLQYEIDQLMDWLPEDLSRRFVRHVSKRVRLGELYAYGIEQGWSKERLDRIDAARRRLDALLDAEDQEEGDDGS